MYSRRHQGPTVKASEVTTSFDGVAALSAKHVDELCFGLDYRTFNRGAGSFPRKKKSSLSKYNFKFSTEDELNIKEQPSDPSFPFLPHSIFPLYHGQDPSYLAPCYTRRKTDLDILSSRKDHSRNQRYHEHTCVISSSSSAPRRTHTMCFVTTLTYLARLVARNVGWASLSQRTTPTVQEKTSKKQMLAFYPLSSRIFIQAYVRAEPATFEYSNRETAVLFRAPQKP